MTENEFKKSLQEIIFFKLDEWFKIFPFVASVMTERNLEDELNNFLEWLYADLNVSLDLDLDNIEKRSQHDL